MKDGSESSHANYSWVGLVVLFSNQRGQALVGCSCFTTHSSCFRKDVWGEAGMHHIEYMSAVLSPLILVPSVETGEGGTELSLWR